jgi:SAM-dependent methyltransferase
MTGLAMADGTLAGALAWYSTVHTPPPELPVVFREFHRVLAPGGHLLMAFKAGDERRHLDHAYGHDLSLDVYHVRPEHVSGLLTDAGFEEIARLVRAAEGGEKSPQGYLLARKRAQRPRGTGA